MPDASLMTAPAERLLIVANRLPLTIRHAADQWRADVSAGGLVAAVGPVMERRGGLWLGWPGDSGSVDDPARAALLAEWERDRGFAAVELPPRVTRNFYEGYSNNTLWPLLHGFPTRAHFEPATWLAYRDANERFAAATLARHRKGDLVWVHDYQLMLVPEILRAAEPEARIGFFLHIPFPGAETFRVLPEREAILRGLLGADFIAFQTHGHLNDFRRALLHILGIESQMDRVEIDGRVVHLAALPIGIVADGWDRLIAENAAVERRIRDLRNRNADLRLVLAVDRLDYTKGIPERLRAFRRLLHRKPAWRGKVRLIQVAIPSRERIPNYAELRSEVSELVGEINGEFGTPEWNPVVYIRRSISPEELAALYVVADVAWVAPLRDGMNLVAKEFIACQAGGVGVLVISEFAGAAQEMGEAIRVNPYDEEGSAEAVDRALNMPDSESRGRQAALLARVRRNDALAWSERFIDGLRAATTEERNERVKPTAEPPMARLVEAAATAKRRAIYVDYDGTLVPIEQRPEDALPTPEVVRLLTALAGDPRTTMVVVSGRQRADLDTWFSGIDGLWLAAEHGAIIRNPSVGAWLPLRPGVDVSWKARVGPMLQAFADRAPGSFIEEKEFALALHYRLTEPEFGEWLANELSTQLEQQLAGTELVALRGNKVIEVRFAWATKGEVAAHVRHAVGRSDFELAIGDDRTDEDLFERLPKRAWTIRVGRATSTRARYRLANPAAVLGLLNALSDAEANAPPTD
jgi:trehalose 6-phosphate synthase/phosphatase